MANVLAVFAQFERRLIGQRTREALAVKRLQGVRLGRRPVIMPATVRAQIDQKCSPMEVPANGPPRNLTVLSKNTEAHFKAG